MNFVSKISILTSVTILVSTAGANPEALIAGAFTQYQSDFQTEEGQPVTDQVLGFQWERQGDESWIQIFEVKSANQLGSELYDCHLDEQVVHCNYLESKAPMTYAAGPRKYKLANMQKAASEALKLIAAKVDPINDVMALKLWHSGKLMQLKVTSKSAVSYLNCHQHGADIDCHRQPKVGADEPGF